MRRAHTAWSKIEGYRSKETPIQTFEVRDDIADLPKVGDIVKMQHRRQPGLCYILRVSLARPGRLTENVHKIPRYAGYTDLVSIEMVIDKVYESEPAYIGGRFYLSDSLDVVGPVTMTRNGLFSLDDYRAVQLTEEELIDATLLVLRG